jgi:hypothetical protein
VGQTTNRAFAVLVLTALPVFGQATWGGLRFGMTESEVKAVLKGRVAATGNALGTQMYTPLNMPSVTVGSAKGRGTLSFDVKTKTLQRIWLDFSRYDKDTSAEVSQDESSTRITTYNYISRSLLEKYGRPVNATGYCPTEDELVEHFVRDSHGSIKCTRLWRAPHQTIGMELAVIGQSLFLQVEYKSTSGAGSEL